MRGGKRAKKREHEKKVKKEVPTPKIERRGVKKKLFKSPKKRIGKGTFNFSLIDFKVERFGSFRLLSICDR